SELLPYLPKFHHALLDLTRFDPATEEHDTRLRVVLQLMKLARTKELLPFFHWLAGLAAAELSDSLLRQILLYALHADSDLDAKKIFHTLSANPELEKNIMSVAEKLKAEGRVEGRDEGRRQGRDEGLWIGKIQVFEEILGRPQTSREILEAKPLAELEALHQQLFREYEVRFKRL
ncbi:hypothetical protein HQ447_12635, partial [bacterium]|nr:hypothetical protein [bacterium]